MREITENTWYMVGTQLSFIKEDWLLWCNEIISNLWSTYYVLTMPNVIYIHLFIPLKQEAGVR